MHQRAELDDATVENLMHALFIRLDQAHRCEVHISEHISEHNCFPYFKLHFIFSVFSNYFICLDMPIVSVCNTLVKNEH